MADLPVPRFVLYRHGLLEWSDLIMMYVWTYDYAKGGAHVWRTEDQGHVAHVPNGLVAQAMCNWLAVYTAGELDLTINPPAPQN